LSRAAARLTRARTTTVLFTLAGLLAVSILGAAAIGSVRVDLGRAFDFAQRDNPDFVILFRTRLPRVLLGAAVGGGLAVAGAALQALLRNSLASPDVVGVSGGASAGAVIAIAAGAEQSGWSIVPLAAFAGSILTIALLVRLSTVHGRMNPYSLLLIGVVVNTIAAALILIVSSMVDALRAQGVLFWLSGSLAQRRYAVVATVFAYMAVGTLALWAQARSLNVLALGEDAASQLGVDVPRVRRWTFLSSGLLVGAAVSVSGIIGFIGLIVPHCLRLAFGSDQRLLLPASFLGGATFLVWADTAARWIIAPAELPVGAITALAGGPFFIVLLRQRQGATLA
jgi:iron complex transport system permease protein